MPFIGARGCKHTLELDTCQHVGIDSVPIAVTCGGLVAFKTWGDDDSTNRYGVNGLYHGMIDGFPLAELNALEALTAAGTVQAAFRLVDGLLL